MAARRTKVKIILIVILIGGITLFHYLTEMKEHLYHLSYQGLYFVPVMLAGFWFGLKGGLGTSLSITILYLPFTVMHWEGFSAGDFNSIIEMVLYNTVAVVIGGLRDREKTMQRRLHEAGRLAAMGKAVSGLAHDLKTPLIAIGGFSRLIQRNLGEDSPHREKLGIIVEEVQRLERMIKEMLDFSRPLELHRSQEDMTKVISQSLVIVSNLAQERKVRVEWQSSQNLPLISLDAVRMKQALINLLINAIEASPEEETVSVYSYQKGRKITIDVSDHGCGIPVDKKEEIFSPFVTTKESGTGLGLPIAKKIIEAHQGYLEVLENREKGVIFRIRIPYES
jgi:two-component system, NtrC family, sensor histidine kinase HydH